MSLVGEQNVNLTYALAVIGMRNPEANPRCVGVLLTAQVDGGLRFGMTVARFPNADEAAEHAASELESNLRMHVEPVLVAGGPEMTLSAPAQALHSALRSSELAVTAIRPERTVEVRLCDALENARQIARQHLLHTQGVTTEHDGGTWLPLLLDFGPYRTDAKSATTGQ